MFIRFNLFFVFLLLISCSNSNEELFDAIESNNNVKLKEILEQNKLNLNSRDSRGFTPIYLACINNNEEAVKLLLNHGASPDYFNESDPEKHREDMTNPDQPLTAACMVNSYPIVKLLLSYGSTVSYDQREFEILINKKNYDAFKLLINNLGNQELKGCIYSRHFITVAKIWKESDSEERNNLLKISELLLKTGMDINCQDDGDNGNTALHISCKENIPEFVNFLCDKGADVNRANNLGESPLHLAVIYSDIRIVEKLVEFSSDMNAKNNYYEETPYSIAVSRDKKEIIELFNKHLKK